MCKLTFWSRPRWLGHPPDLFLLSLSELSLTHKQTAAQIKRHLKTNVHRWICCLTIQPCRLQALLRAKHCSYHVNGTPYLVCYLKVARCNERERDAERKRGAEKRVCASTPQWLPDYLQMGSGGLAECGGSPWHAAHMIKYVIALQFTWTHPTTTTPLWL